jgi:hypothetical protein
VPKRDFCAFGAEQKFRGCARRFRERVALIGNRPPRRFTRSDRSAATRKHCASNGRHGAQHDETSGAACGGLAAETRIGFASAARAAAHAPIGARLISQVRYAPFLWHAYRFGEAIMNDLAGLGAVAIALTPANKRLKLGHSQRLPWCSLSATADPKRRRHSGLRQGFPWL